MRRCQLPIALLLMSAPVLHARQADGTTLEQEPVCIEVQVNGERIPAWDCLQKKLAPQVETVHRVAPPEAERLMRQPGSQMLQYNLEGTRQRMGSAFGHSVVPQRPTP